MKAWGSLSSVSVKLQVDSDKLFPALYIIHLDSTVKLAVVRIRHFTLCEFFSLCFVLCRESIHICVYMLLYYYAWRYQIDHVCCI